MVKNATTLLYRRYTIVLIQVVTLIMITILT